MKPAAGILGVITHPAQGAWKTMQKSWAREQEQYNRKTRMFEGVTAVQGGSKLDHDEIIERFRNAKPATKDRKKKYKDMAEKEMYTDAKPRLPDRTYTSSISSRASTSSPSTPRSEPAAQISIASQDEDDAAFERDLEMAKQLSLAEQRGYERGLAGAK